MKKVLTIAGSDSCGGAGIQADLKTFTMLGVYGMTAVTSVTSQNTKGVLATADLPPDMVEKQIDAVAADIPIDAVKTGMLSSESIIVAVAKALGRHNFRNLVVDPVMRAKSGDPLIKAGAQEALKKLIVPHALIVTPNIPEAKTLAGLTIKKDADMEEAARRIKALGPRYVLIKGGARDEEKCEDLFFDGTTMQWLSAPRVEGPAAHGAGCTHSAAIAAGLALGREPFEAVRIAKSFVQEAIRQREPVGKGAVPVNHLWPYPKPAEPKPAVN
jgi:hydroxymethylpyrimidine/phosphomethylpyrimidine kinase